MASRSAEGDEERRAQLVLSSRCIQHDCAGHGCADRNHRRDAAFLRHCLELTGLAGRAGVEEKQEEEKRE